VPDLSAGEVVVRLVLAALLGGAIGLEREIREREAGLRTHLLVSIGAALFTLVSAYAWTDFRFSTPEGLVFDPTRIAAQIVTGIGFLGAGAIIRQGLSVRGLTTAATLWAVAAIGMASGAGYYWAAVVTTALVLVTLWPLRIAAYRLFVRARPEEGRLHVRLRPGKSVAPVLMTLEGAGGRVASIELEDVEDARRADVRLRFAERAQAAEAVEQVTRLDEVQSAQWNP
jgi:putative Mg2+ transporter-C (MgtC) family protein